MRIGGDTVGITNGITLRVYAADGGIPRYQLPFAHTSGVPRLLTIGNGYAAYTQSGRIMFVPAANLPLSAKESAPGLAFASSSLCEHARDELTPAADADLLEHGLQVILDRVT